MSIRPTVLAYYFPDWHLDERNAAWFGTGFTEWRLLEQATPRFPGHRQPRTPLLGTFDESDPSVFAAQVELAGRYGIDGFLVDYYWYEDGSYLEGVLQRGLHGIDPESPFTFALMWANHDLVDIFPRADGRTAPLRLASGSIDRAAFEAFGRHIIENYFRHPRYLKVDGAPWLSIYEIGSLLEGLGGVEETADALDWLRSEVVTAGFPGLHLDGVVWGFGVLPTAVKVDDPFSLLERLRFDSATSYVWIHHMDVADHAFPAGDWAAVRADAFADYSRIADAVGVPFHPNVTVGWDSSPRTNQAIEFEAGEYPFYPTWDPSPEEFEEGLIVAQQFIADRRTPSPVLTINAWNEWTEGSYLLPDTHHRFGFLEAVRRVFGVAGK